MNGEVTVREVMIREFVGVSEADTLRDTGRLMLEEDVEAVVVLRGRSPVGLATQQDVLAAAVEGDDLSTREVAAVMRPDPETVAPDRTLAAATGKMSAIPTRHLLVVEGEDVVGLVSEHDVVTASTLNPGLDGEGTPEPDPVADPGRETAAAEAAGAADAATTRGEYPNQGICEVCGALTRDLSTFNGQLVCADCKDV